MGYTGKIRQGKFIPDDKWAIKKRLCSLEGRQVTVDIKPIRKLRTNEQNRYYWGVVIDLLSDYTGYTPDEMHLALKMEFLKVERAGLLPTARSTTELDTAEFNRYIEQIRDWASMKLNVYIPEPNEYEYENN